MILANSKRFRRCAKAAIAAATFTALTVVSFVPAATEAEPAASDPAASAQGAMTASRKVKHDGDIRGHGFVRDGECLHHYRCP